MYEMVAIDPVDGYRCWQLGSVLTCKLNIPGADILCGLVIRSGNCIWGQVKVLSPGSSNTDLVTSSVPNPLLVSPRHEQEEEEIP